MERRKIGWNFPSNNNSEIKGLQDAGTETFKGSIFGSLAREICQNSLDARVDENKPVRIIFDFAEVERETIKDIDTLSEVLGYCGEFFKQDKKTNTFFEKAKEISNRKKIRVLRIGDYNTTGLTGAEKKEYAPCPWQDLVKSSGVSNKNGTSGGSFGIGKYAPFVCSDLRTIFYSTYDKTGVKAYQGVANLVSFRYPKDCNDLGIKAGDIAQGKGYYGITSDNSAVLEPLNFNGHCREESGTDLFILGFIESENWEIEIIKCVIEEYLISILNDKLQVEVAGKMINSQTIHNMINENFKENSLTYNYYRVLTDKNTVVENINFCDMGDIELRVLIEKDFKRKVLMARNTGMKIFDLDRISSTIPFAGVCILKSDAVNSYFREMENPQHNKWESDRHRNRKEAEERRKKLSREIRERIFALGKEQISDQMDAVGMGDIIPDLVSTENNEEKKGESIGNSIKTFSSPTKKKVRKTDTGINMNELYGNADIDVPGIINEDGEGGGKAGHSFPGNGNGNGGKFVGYLGGTGDVAEDGNTNVRVSENIQPLKTRIIYNNKDKSYRLSFTMEESYNDVIIGFIAVGEQGNTKISVDNARVNDKKVQCRNGKIQCGRIEKGIRYVVEYQTAFTEMCCMEVKMDGYRI